MKLPPIRHMALVSLAAMPVASSAASDAISAYTKHDYEIAGGSAGKRHKGACSQECAALIRAVFIAFAKQSLPYEANSVRPLLTGERSGRTHETYAGAELGADDGKTLGRLT
jgi:hypothetical protein